MKIRTIIVDDEDLARQVLREDLESFPNIEIVAECCDGFEAVKAITQLAPDLVFLDIQMPKLSGFEVLELLDEAPRIIFATAYDEFALNAFEVHAIDYLLKPFSRQRVEEALQAVEQTLGNPPHYPVAEISSQMRSGRPLERLLVKDGSRVTVIPIQDVDYLEAQDDYVCIHFKGKERLKQQTLSELEKLLDESEFVRIHRSYILNIRRLARIELYAKDSRLAVLLDGRQLPISRSGYSRLKTLL